MNTLRFAIFAFILLFSTGCRGLGPWSPTPRPPLPTAASAWDGPLPEAILREDRDGKIEELRPHYPGGRFQSLYVDYRNGSWVMWLSSGYFDDAQRDTRTQRFTSADGLTWSNRTDTTLTLESVPYTFVLGPRQVLYDGELYQAWEEMYPTTSFGWARGVRYETSRDGLNWEVQDGAALKGAKYPSACQAGGVYHLWAAPDGDNNKGVNGGYQGVEALRHRTSGAGGGDWGDWESGGEWVTVDGEKVLTWSRVRCLPGGHFEIFSLGKQWEINRAVSSDGSTFETSQKALVSLADLPAWAGILEDFAVVNAAGKYRFYATYRDEARIPHIGVLESSQK